MPDIGSKPTIFGREAKNPTQSEIEQWKELQKCPGSLNLPLDLHLSALRGSLATIFVGPGKKYELPMLILCHRLKYFERVFLGNFKEARERVLELPDMNVETFQVFMNWTFTERFRLPGDITSSTENRQHDVALLVDVISWADRWLLEQRHDLMWKAMIKLEEMLHVSIEYLTPGAIDAAFSSGSERMKKLIAQYCAMPYLSWAKNHLSENFTLERFTFERNVEHTPDFMRYISAALVECLCNRQIIHMVKGRQVVRLTGRGLYGKGRIVDL